QGEALGLRWEDIDLDGGTLTVSYALQRIDGEYRLVRPKTKKSEGRVIALPDRTLAALREHKIRHRKEQLASKVWVGTEHDLVFTDDHGLPLSGVDLTKRFKRLLKSAGLPEIRFHDLRHSCATLLLVQGIPAKVVADILGHSTVNLTLNLYSHVVPSLRREAAAAMDRALGG
ncbi:MAG TPA: site-specific integrase, partial [Candidatus Nitrosotalea sp.]|nr:site-specific integrase [Candidatus Nitrosotalea sp.]